LLVSLSLALLTVAKNRAVVLLAAIWGFTGILTVSFPNKLRVIFFVHVTSEPICTPHDHPLFENALRGHKILSGIVMTTVCMPVELVFPTFVTVIGIVEICHTWSSGVG